MHHVVQGLVVEDEDGQQRAHERPGRVEPPGIREPGSTQAQGNRDKPLGRVMPDAIEEHTGRRRCLPPPRNLAIGAVPQHLHLPEQRRENAPGQTRDKQREGRRRPGRDHEPGDLVGSDRRAQEQPGQVRRDITQVDIGDPVLGVAPAGDRRWLADLSDLRDGRPWWTFDEAHVFPFIADARFTADVRFTADARSSPATGWRR